MSDSIIVTELFFLPPKKNLEQNLNRLPELVCLTKRQFNYDYG